MATLRKQRLDWHYINVDKIWKSMHADPAAAAIVTVTETLALIDGPFAAVAEGVAEDRYVFWIGSGTSFGRVDVLHRVIAKVIEFLRA